MVSASRMPRWSRRRSLSHRYITDRFLPDKAIDLIDEAASRLKMELDSMPTEIDRWNARSSNSKSSRGAEKGKRRGRKERLQKPRKGARRSQGESQPALRPNGKMKKPPSTIRSIVKSQIEQAQIELEQAQRRGDLTSSLRNPIRQIARAAAENSHAAKRPIAKNPQASDCSRRSHRGRHRPRSSPHGPAFPSPA